MSSDQHLSQIDADWYATAFGDLYTVLYAHRTVEAAAPEAAFAAQVLELRPHDRLLDLCCGCGRHLYHLAQVTNRAVGLDYSPELLRCGRALLGDLAKLVRGDMRAIPFVDSFDCVANFFTSFGYFQSDAENSKVAVGIRASLKTGGRFLIDYVNASNVRATLTEHSEKTVGPYDVSEDRWVDNQTRRVNKVIAIRKDGGLVRKIHESVRLYEPDEINALLKDAGLIVTNMYGDWSGAPFEASSPRMIVKGTTT